MSELGATANDPIFQRTTNRVRLALAFGQQAAVRQGEAAVSAGQLLLGLVHEGGGVAAQALNQHGIDGRRLTQALAGEPITPLATGGRLSGLARAVQSLFSRRDQPAPATGLPPLSAAAERAWRQADVIRRQRGEDFLATEHLLLGLIEAERGEVARLLTTFGTTAPALRASVWGIIEAAMRRGGGV